MTHKLVSAQTRALPVDIGTTRAFVNSQDREVDALKTHARAARRLTEWLKGLDDALQGV